MVGNQKRRIVKVWHSGIIKTADLRRVRFASQARSAQESDTSDDEKYQTNEISNKGGVARNITPTACDAIAVRHRRT